MKIYIYIVYIYKICCRIGNGEKLCNKLLERNLNL